MSDPPPNKDLIAQLDQFPTEVLQKALKRKQGAEDGRLVASVEEYTERFSGPLPPPDWLANYDKITPGFADRIVSMAEKEQVHRHTIEQSALNSAVAIETRGQKIRLSDRFA